MSWSIKAVGSRAGILKQVQANGTMPDSLKSALAVLILEPGDGNYNATPNKPHNACRVEGAGHSGGGYGSIQKLEVELMTIDELPSFAAQLEALNPPAAAAAEEKPATEAAAPAV